MDLLFPSRSTPSSTRTLSADRRMDHAKRSPHPALALFLLAALLSLAARAETPHADTVLTKAAQVHGLPPALAPTVRVHLVGTLTYYDPHDGVMFFADDSGGVYIDTHKSYPLHTGDKVSVDGFAQPSYRTEIATDPEIHYLGHGDTFHPPEYTYSQLASGQADSALVTIRGFVRSQDVEEHDNSPEIHLDVVMDNGELQVYLDPSFGANPPSYLDSTVLLTGAAGGTFDTKNQLTGIVLYVPSPKSIRILHPPVHPLDQLPITDINDVFRSAKVEDKSTRVRVRGILTFYRKGESAVLEHSGQSIYVQTRQTADLTPGDIVDAFGFASNREYAPSLRLASLIRTGQRADIQPQPISYANALSGNYSDNLVSLTGTLVSQIHEADASQLHHSDAETLILESDGHMVRALLRTGPTLPFFRIGSRLRITGICRIIPGGPFRYPSVFHIDMRSPADVEVLAKPSWFTVRHLIAVLAASLVLAVAIAIWAFLLQRRVRLQHRRIKRSMKLARERSRILEMISANRPIDPLLSTICNSIDTLLPGTRCTYTFHPTATVQPPPPDASHTNRLFQTNLTGDLNEPLGSIVVSRLDGYIPRDDRHEIFELLEETSRLAIRQLLLHQALVHHSTHDPLTELPNRRLCEARLAEALNEATLHASSLSLIYIDVDLFKEVNDQHGHRIGDLYLQQITARLLAAKRADDTLARIGGDEFLLIVPSTSEHSPALLARLEACFDHPFAIEGRLISGSASLGMATYPEHGHDAESLKLHADHAMYKAKRSKPHHQPTYLSEPA